MERVNSDELTIDEIKAKIRYYIDEYKEIDPEHVNIFNDQSQFTACLEYVFQNAFRAPKGMRNNRKSIINSLDVELLEEIRDYYIWLCNFHKRDLSLEGFLELTGIDDNVAYKYINMSDNEIYSTNEYIYNNNIPKQYNNINLGYTVDTKEKLSTFWKDTKEKLEKKRKEKNRGKLYDSNGAMGATVIGNVYYGYSTPQTQTASNQSLLIARDDVNKVCIEPPKIE